MADDDDVQLTDLEVIQRYSLAVRGATAARADLIAALQADLDWLRSGRSSSSATARAKAAPAKGAQARPASAAAAPPAKSARTAAAKSAKSTPAKASAAPRKG